MVVIALGMSIIRLTVNEDDSLIAWRAGDLRRWGDSELAGLNGNESRVFIG